MKRSAISVDTASRDRSRGLPSLAPRHIVAFLGKSLFLYGLLLLAWPIVGDAYAAYLRAGGNLLFGTWGTRGRVEFRAPSEPDGKWDMVSVVTNLERGKSGLRSHSSNLLGYLPTATLAALVLASPMPRARRIRALIWGLLWVNLFVAFRMGLGILADFCSNDACALYVVRPWTRWILDLAVFVFLFAPAAYFVAPVCIWILVTFRRTDWDALFGRSKRSA